MTATERAAVSADRLRLKREPRTATGVAARASVGGAPPNDDCGNATAVVGAGSAFFNNALATEDGFAHDACIDTAFGPLGNITHDIWYLWTSNCEGVVRADTCAIDAVDTRLAVYRTPTCTPDEVDLVNLGCNDDFCGLQSSVSFSATDGEVFLIRVGSYPGGTGSCVGGSNPGTQCFFNTLDVCLDGGVCEFALPPDPGGPGELTISCVDLPCDQPGENCQGPFPFDGINSDGVLANTADDFTPAADADIASLCWQGNYIFDFPSFAQFEVRYFDNLDGLPGNLIGGPFLQSDQSLTVMGPENNAVGIDFEVFEYSATHAPVHVEAGECYWLEIRSDPDANLWFWQLAQSGNGFSLHDAGLCQGGDGDGKACAVTPCAGGVCTGPDGYEPIDLLQVDFSFCLSTSLGDNIYCQPPSDGGCSDAEGDCFAEDSPINCATDTDCPAGRFCDLDDLVRTARTGCEDETCCNRVCACDPFCCTGEWDEFCAIENLFTPGCDSPTRCPSLSGGCTDIVSSVLGDCTIDARQPFDIDGTNPAGIDEITLTLNDGCDASTVPTAFYRVLTAGGARGSDVLAAAPNGNSVVLSLDAPIEVRQWTCFSHPELSGQVCVGNLPGDVNGDGTSNPALDLGAIIDCINNPGTCQDHQANIDRSGDTPGVLDITRLIDLFNGAGAYESFTGATIGGCPAP